MVWPAGSAIRVGHTVKVAGTFNGLGVLLATKVTIYTLNHIATLVSCQR
jgi:hypothetical protein